MIPIERFLKRLEKEDVNRFRKLKKDIEKQELLLRIHKEVPLNPTALPYYAYQYFNNPHHLDLSASSSDLKLITTLLASKYNVETPDLSDRRALDALFERHNLYFERGMNHVITYNVFEGEHLYQIVPKKYIHQMIIKPALKNVQLHENAGIFDMLTDKYPDQSFICTSGVMNSAVMILIERLKQERKHMTYSGDMDMNGLWIANRLLSVYPAIELKGMSEELFLKYATNQKINSKDKLSHIKDPVLHKIAQHVADKSKVCYQEAVYDYY